MRYSEISNSARVISTNNRAPNTDAIIDGLAKVEASVSKSALPAHLVMPHALFNNSAETLFACEKLLSLLSAEGERAEAFSIGELIHVQDRVLFAHTVSEVAQNKQEKTIEVRLVDHSLDQDTELPTWVEICIFKIDDASTSQHTILATFRDISQRKKVQEELEEAKTIAEEVSIAKSRFLASTSHELRTPLNAILGFSDLLMSPMINTLDDSKRTEYTSLINDSAQHLLSVLNGILDMSKIESGKYEITTESFDVSKCLLNTVAIMRGMAQASQISLNTIGLCDLPEIVADQQAMKQIFINLISNAIKFSEDGSNVNVRAERHARTIKIYVEDSGIGISPEHLEHLGKPFFQADSKYDRRYEGTGLGLSVVRGLVELHEGKLDFSSSKDEGTSVCVTLPIHGKLGRQVPASENTEKITPIFSSESKPDFRIARTAR